jgi:hypothetical protein
MTCLRLKSAAFAAVLAVSAGATHAATPLISEGFNAVSSLAASGWVLTNASSPVGSVPGWYQGDVGIFTALSGSGESYAASNYNVAAAGGTVSNWLITPAFSTATDVVVSFWAKADIADGYSDQLAYGFSASGSSSIAAFTLGAPTTVSGNWVQYTLSFAAQGAGSTARFAVASTGSADLANYVGIDSLSVSAVPEPAAWLMFGGGLLALAVARRRKA